MTTAWYYDYYEKEVFPNQQQLCDAVRWTACNLEGQRVSPTTLIHVSSDGTEEEYKTEKLTGELANPLTIRLLGAREALNQLESKVKQIDEAIKKRVERQFDKGEVFGIKGTFHAQDSPTETRGAPVETIEIGESKPYEFPHAIVHLTLYEFFTNFGSITDRLAYEINLLYKLQIPKVHWPRLVDMRPRKDEYWKRLDGKDPMLARFIRDSASKLEQALSYRNRLIHDGIIRIKVDIGLLANRGISVLSVKLPQDANNNDSPMDVDAIEFCKEAKADVLKLLDGSYKIMLQHLQTHGKPPW